MNGRLFLLFINTTLFISICGHCLGMPNAEIRAMYTNAESVMKSQLANNRSLDDNGRALLIDDFGYYRFRSVVKMFLPIIEYNPYFDLDNNSVDETMETVRTTTGRMLYGAGIDSPLRQRYPVFAALLRIGVSFNEIHPHFLEQAHIDRLYMYACLGKAIGGVYFNDYFNECPAVSNTVVCSIVSNTVFKSKMENTIALPLSGKTEMASRYDAMQNELISRFKSQLENGDSELADTIHTMGFIRSDKAMPLLIENLTVCPQTATNSPSGLVFPAAEALISIWPPLGICFEQLEAAQPLSLEESLWLRITHEVYPEAVEYDLQKKAEQGDKRAARLLASLPWRKLGALKADIERQPPVAPQ